MSPQRPDLSPYIVHLTRDYLAAGNLSVKAQTEARDNLFSILHTQTLEARTPYGIAVRHLEQEGCGGADFTDSQKVACFSETPLEHLSGLIDPSVWRRYRFQPYGLAFSKEYMLDQGANPVWYVNTYPGSSGFRWLARDINKMIDEAAFEDGRPSPERWQASPIARLTPYIEATGRWNTGYMGAQRAKDFTWEREWRYQGDFFFRSLKVEAVIVPTGEVDSVREELSAMLTGPMGGILVKRAAFVEMEVPAAAEDIVVG